MGKRGPKKTPSKKLRLRGSWRADENEKHEVEAPAGMPDMPDWLQGEAAEMWDRLSAQLYAIGILSEVDRNVLSRYCATWEQWRKAYEFVLEFGQTYKRRDAQGKIIGSALWAETRLLRDLGSELSRMESTLGIGSANRFGIKSNNNDKPTGDARFFG